MLHLLPTLVEVDALLRALCWVGHCTICRCLEGNDAPSLFRHEP